MIEFETLPASSREKTEYLDFATMILGGPGGYSRSNIPDYFSSRDENTDEHDIGPAVAQWKYPHPIRRAFTSNHMPASFEVRLLMIINSVLLAFEFICEQTSILQPKPARFLQH